MTTATLIRQWTGRSGTVYVPVVGAKSRRGGMSTVIKVVPKDQPGAVPVALKLWNEGDEASLDQLQRETQVLERMAERGGDLPCPTVVDRVGQPLVTGLVMEWCPAHLGSWWRDSMTESDAFGRLMATFAEVSRRVSDYHVFFAATAEVAAHGDLKPSNILLNADGHWRIGDFGTARVGRVDDASWDQSQRVIATENFLAPEVLFGAKRRHPAAVDTWSLGATLFALLKMRRMAGDGQEMPRNGTHSPRFRTVRTESVREVYARDPRRFRGQELKPEAFEHPTDLPEEDLRDIRSALSLLLPDEEMGGPLVLGVVEILERSMSIDPALRYTSCRDLAAAFQQLTRMYLATEKASGSSHVEESVHPVEDDDDELVSPRVLRLEREIARLELALSEPQAAAPAAFERFLVPTALAVSVVLQGTTLAAVLVGLFWTYWQT